MIGSEGSVVVPAGHQSPEGPPPAAFDGNPYGNYDPSAAVDPAVGEATGLEGSDGEVQQVQYGAPYGGDVYHGYPGYASPVQAAAGGTTVPRYIAGVTTPPWGMTTSGTPIGLPGPPHIPHGIPAGLKKHTMRNFTPHFLPQPTKHVNVWMKQSPGFSYPKPANNMFIHERTHHLMPHFRQPAYDRFQLIRDGKGGGGYQGGGGGGYPGGGGFCPNCQ